MTSPPEIGVLVMSYGTPATVPDIETYYTHIRRGRAPSPEQLDDLKRRYQAIGGLSPLAAMTTRQARGLARALEQSHPGRYQVAVGSKHSPPFIEDTVADLARRGAARLVGVVMAPHYARASVGEYLERATSAAGRLGLPIATIAGWHLDAGLISLLANRLTEALGTLAPEAAQTCPVLFSAHSLPVRATTGADAADTAGMVSAGADTARPASYPEQLAATAHAVGQRAAVGPDRVRLTWQSAGRTPEPWIGPDISETLGELAAQGYTDAVVCPAGFTSDHLEILYDLDIEAQARARCLGINLVRTRSLNDDPDLMATLACLVVQAR